MGCTVERLRGSGKTLWVAGVERSEPPVFAEALGARSVSRNMRYCREIATRSSAESRDEYTLRDSPSDLVPVGGHPMPRPIPVPVRQAIWQRFRDGQDCSTIAVALGLAPRTVRALIQRFRQEG